MSVKGAGKVSIKLPAAPKTPKPKAVVIQGPGVPKMKSPGVQKVPTLMSLAVKARRGEAPKLQLAKAAAGASSTRGKRNPDYPTP